MPSYSKWSSNGPIGQGLREEIIKGDYIRCGITAGEVWKNNKKYNKYYKLENFRTNFNKMKKKIQEEQNDKKTSAALNELHGTFDGKFIIFLMFEKKKQHKKVTHIFSFFRPSSSQ